jgi:hypothetical protein
MAEEKKTMDMFQEKWIKGVTITTTILAVLTAIGSARAAYCVAQSQLLTALEGSKWAYYQAKSIKENLMETQMKAFEFENVGTLTPQQKFYLENNMKSSQETLARYQKEKEEIKQEAEKVGRNNAIVSKRGGNFSMSVVFFQIAIMLSSVSALLKKKEMWVVGLIFGVIAIVLLANAAFLFF